MADSLHIVQFLVNYLHKFERGNFLTAYQKVTCPFNCPHWIAPIIPIQSTDAKHMTLATHILTLQNSDMWTVANSRGIEYDRVSSWYQFVNRRDMRTHLVVAYKPLGIGTTYVRDVQQQGKMTVCVQCVRVKNSLTIPTPLVTIITRSESLTKLRTYVLHSTYVCIQSKYMHVCTLSTHV